MMTKTVSDRLCARSFTEQPQTDCIFSLIISFF
jgi:hypothetical protein